MKRRVLVVTLLALLALANAAWLHDFGGHHDHDQGDAPSLVYTAYSGAPAAPVAVSAGPPVVVSYELPALVCVDVVYPRRVLPPTRAPSPLAASPRAPPFA